MRFIKKKLRTIQKKTGKLYIYEVSDELGNTEEVYSMQDCAPNERVELFFDSKWDKVKIKKGCG